MLRIVWITGLFVILAGIPDTQSYSAHHQHKRTITCANVRCAGGRCVDTEKGPSCVEACKDIDDKCHVGCKVIQPSNWQDCSVCDCENRDCPRMKCVANCGITTAENGCRVCGTMCKN